VVVDIKKIPSSHRPDREGSIRGTLRNYPEPVNIISEFIQNAEDVHSKNIRFEVSRDSLRIVNDGNHFIENDYLRICEFARGKWDEPDKIGKFGVGFISVYHLTNSPTIISNGVELTIESDGTIRKRRHADSADMKGSTFLLPFRRHSTPFSGRISVEKVNDARLKDFIKGFRNAFYRCILFLSDINTIEGWERYGKSRRLACKCTREELSKREEPLGDGGTVTFKKVLVRLEWREPESQKMLT